MDDRTKEILDDALLKLKEDVIRLVEALRLDGDTDISSWTRIVDGKLHPRLSPDFPLMVVICGGGSSGKSTLFNSLVGDRLSPSGGMAGINRRILVSAPGDLFRKKSFVSTLFEPFGSVSKPLENKEELTVPGCPLYVMSNSAPRNMVLMDTPDFDTGAKGAYVNREVVRQALETSDVMIYIFTNANYNNKDNTDFVAKMLTGIGMRKCFLLYRVDNRLSESEAMEHSMTVAKNIYGSNYEDNILGYYRTDEDNAVAGNDAFMEIYPIRSADPPFEEALKRLDPHELRPELLGSILNDVLQIAERIVAEARISHEELNLYLDTIQSIQGQCVREALQHFPMNQVMRRFMEIWCAKDPGYIKVMRQTGNAINLPVKAISGAYRWVKGRMGEGKDNLSNGQYKDKVDEDLLSAVNILHYKMVESDVMVSLPTDDPTAKRMFETVEHIRKSRDIKGMRPPHVDSSEDWRDYTFRIAAHPAVYRQQETLRDRDWKNALKSVLSQKDIITSLSEGIEVELEALANEFRKKMGFMAKAKQLLFAILNIVPATVAVTYVLHTGDPVGATGIKVQLSGLFGLNDLYALVAIPATTGLVKADQKQLETILAPIAQTWLNDKLKAVQVLFEDEITGEIIHRSKNASEAAELLIEHIEMNIETIRKATSL